LLQTQESKQQRRIGIKEKKRNVRQGEATWPKKCVQKEKTEEIK